jgi:glycerophosphoryl diester phosphodiesterase
MSILLIFLLSVMPQPDPQRGVPASDSIDVQGHRGARGLLPENTVPSFLRALELGVTTLEMDVVVSADGEVVLSHEPWFSSEICSTPNGHQITPDREKEHNIFRLTMEEIAAYDCGSRGNPRFPRQESMAVSKPTLREVIRRAEAYREEYDLAEFDYNIETKSRPEWDGVYHPDPDLFAELLHRVVTEEGILARTTLQSFDVRTLQWARENDPSWRLVLLIARDSDIGVDAHLDRLGFNPYAYSPDYRLVDAIMVQRVQELGMKLIPWTVNTSEEMQHLISLGVDGIITDYPDIAIDLVRSK